jgi:Mor transcription activator family
MNDRQTELFKASLVRSSLDDLDQDECNGRISVRQIAEVIGDEAAHKLARDFGGTRRYIPADPDDSHPLTLSIGREDALAIAAKFAGEELVLPMYKSRSRRQHDRALILELKARHRSNAAIARQVGCSERHVYNVLAETESRR